MFIELWSVFVQLNEIGHNVFAHILLRLSAQPGFDTLRDLLLDGLQAGSAWPIFQQHQRRVLTGKKGLKPSLDVW